MKLPTGTLVAVLDGANYILFRNDGDEDIINLSALDSERLNVPPTRELGTDRPGEFRPKNLGHGSPEARDLHEQAETHFAKKMLARIETYLAKDTGNKIVIVSDPDTLGQIRKEYSATLKSQLLEDIAKNFSDHPVPDIEKFLKSYQS